MYQQMFVIVLGAVVIVFLALGGALDMAARIDGQYAAKCSYYRRHAQRKRLSNRQREEGKIMDVNERNYPENREGNCEITLSLTKHRISVSL